MSLYTPIFGAGSHRGRVRSGVRGDRAKIGPRRFNRAKLEAYECGIEPVAGASSSKRFPIKYYPTAMLFIVFDIEIVFLYPWAVASTSSAPSPWWRC